MEKRGESMPGQLKRYARCRAVEAGLAGRSIQVRSLSAAKMAIEASHIICQGSNMNRSKKFDWAQDYLMLSLLVMVVITRDRHREISAEQARYSCNATGTKGPIRMRDDVNHQS